jgi:hypothetical protein
VTTKQFKIPMPRFGERRLSLYRPFWIAINPEFNPHEREVDDAEIGPKRPSSRSRCRPVARFPQGDLTNVGQIQLGEMRVFRQVTEQCCEADSWLPADSDCREAAVDRQLHPIHEARFV